MRRPRCAVRQLRRDVLAEQARDMLALAARACRRASTEISISTIGLLRPAVRARVEIGLLHVGEARRDDDAGGVMLGQFACPAGR